jgi:S-adenosylmethionine decarboxylase
MEPTFSVGKEWIVECSGVRPEVLRDATRLRAVCERVIQDIGLHVVGDPQWHTFPGAGGVTGLYLLSESHLACHTYPEYSAATFNLYCCRERSDWPWHEQLKALLGANKVDVRAVSRNLKLIGRT